MPSKVVRPSGNRTRLARCKSPWQSRTNPSSNRILDWISTSAETRLPIVKCNGHGVEIDAWSPGLIQPDLLLAVEPALFNVTEIEKIEHDRLFDLVGIAIGENKPGNVCLDQIDICHRLAERIRAHQ